MDIFQFIAPADTALAIKSGLRLLHLVGLVLGLGSATLIDLITFRFFATSTVHEEHWKIVDFSSRVVIVGLAILWISGLGFLAYYDRYSPASLGNPKVWAKIGIVGILSLNGVFIHRRVLPFLKARVGRSLFDGVDSRERLMILASGAVSATSWLMPLVLGSIPQLNFVVPATAILMAYGLLLALAIFLSANILRLNAHGTPAPDCGNRHAATPGRGK